MVIRSRSCARTFAQYCRDFSRLLYFNCQVFFHLILIYIAMTKIEKNIVTSFIAILWCFDILVFRIFGLAAAITTFLKAFGMTTWWTMTKKKSPPRSQPKNTPESRCDKFLCFLSDLSQGIWERDRANTMTRNQNETWYTMSWAVCQGW